MYAIIWEFRPAEGRRDEFEAAYGREGAWARLFSRAEGYLGTDLVRDTADATRYLTIDRWRSRADYDAFRARFADDYAAIDAACERLTSAETLVGLFAEWSGEPTGSTH
jgi:heme-degrading monooxygenase HmoA